MDNAGAICQVCGFPGNSGDHVASRNTPRGQLLCHSKCAHHLKEMAGGTPADAGSGIIFNKPPTS